MGYFATQLEEIRKSLDELNEPVRTIVKKTFFSGQLRDEEWFELREMVREFIKTDPPKEDLQELRGAAETIGMACSAIEEIRSKENGKR